MWDYSFNQTCKTDETFFFFYHVIFKESGQNILKRFQSSRLAQYAHLITNCDWEKSNNI